MDSLMAKERLGTVISNLDLEPDSADMSVPSGVNDTAIAECTARESDQDFGDDWERHKTKDANEEDMKQVTGAFMQAVSATAQKQPVHRCNSFFLILWRNQPRN
ncbi:uncharacterized protein LOC125944702 [Dermacentor silvarum]|uniref:uncharacterized protein LOC125944702 n=1 Tax=Dermacentor silvarum TaxID=543639 RepID=UPI00210074E7|nr:uncharacterized protein LOC125944702 [Dermacentor silvarum]